MSTRGAYRLDAGGQTLVLAGRGDAPLRLIYWGAALPADADLASLARLDDRGVAHGMLDGGEAVDLIPQAARGVSDRPALAVHRTAGLCAVRCRLEQVEETAGGLTIQLIDVEAGVGVTQTLRLHESGVLSVAARLENTGSSPLFVDRLAPCALPCGGDEVVRFVGRWAGEWRTERLTLGGGVIATENRTGRTSHHAPPFLIVGARAFGESDGEVLGIHLGWSGDSESLVERLRDGRIQAQLAPLLAPGEIVLQPGQAWQSPTLHAALSTHGLNGLSDRFHPFVRAEILGGRLTRRPRPVHFNTWEALYFAHDMARLKQLATDAAALGVERFVLDDGWFAGRADDRAGLGDWRPDSQKYPDGLAPLAEHVRALGMELGLWIEPECANLNSDLLRAHPDWILGPRDQPLGRGQYVLDLARAEVADTIFGQIDAMLRTCAIGYLKWDFNRDVTHAPTGAQTRAVYALIDRVRAAHPQIEIEACASGGARADFAMLQRTDRIWISDGNDPFERQRQQRAFSIFFPPETMGAHVGPRTSHTNGRISSMETRALTALFGHMGVEADVSALGDPDRALLGEVIALHKQLRARVHGARTLRLEHSDPGVVAFAIADASGQILSVAQVEAARDPAPAPLHLAHLAPEATYAVSVLRAPAGVARRMKTPPAWMDDPPLKTSGAMLSGKGLPLPALHVGDVLLVDVRRV